ncbi:MAG: DPP IV N-terminal domain-containing protein [Agriterribacter sp.]
MKAIFLFIYVVTVCYTAPAQQSFPAYTPDREQMLERYRFAAFSDSTINRGKIFNTTVQANWLNNGKSFWYRRAFKDSVREYVMVTAATGKRKPLFDHKRLAEALGKATHKKFNPQKLLLSNIQLSKNGRQISFETDDKIWVCNLDSYACKDASAVFFAEPQVRRVWSKANNMKRSRWQPYFTDSVSPNGKWCAVVKEGNVNIRSVADSSITQFTANGTKEKPYGYLAWSPDSKYIIGYRITPYEDSMVHYIATAQPGTTRGVVKSQPYKQPGDPFTTYEMFVMDVENKTTTKVETDIIDFFPAPYLSWRTSNPHRFLFERVERGHQRFRIIEADVTTGKTRTIVEETSHTFIYEQKIYTAYLPATDEMIWISEKDGWRHIYIVNSVTGAVQSVTSGNWVVKDIDSIDVQKRQIWFRAMGMNVEEDPYHVHYYRIDFDGKNMVSLTPAAGTHSIAFSPSREYYLDTYSQVNVPPVVELRKSDDGYKIAEIEKADISHYLAAGFRLPEPFHAKGRDGITDIWGIVFRPTHFDSTQKYPVIENIYAGPQDSFVPKGFTTGGEMQSLAELGFIVVQIDGMGTYNRSKKFHDVCWQNLADAGFADRILWIKALAQQYPYVDAERVGLYGTSAGGQNALGALLFHPEFYSAAVSSCGCHDNRIDKQWWNEQWMVYPVGKHYDEQSNITNAHKLQGDLLLIVGEADTNVPPESTYRVADALIKANKSFDFLAIPGMGHSDGGAYGKKKKRDFFVKKLLGVDPPDRNRGE